MLKATDVPLLQQFIPQPVSEWHQPMLLLIFNRSQKVSIFIRLINFFTVIFRGHAAVSINHALLHQPHTVQKQQGHCQPTNCWPTSAAWTSLLIVYGMCSCKMWGAGCGEVPMCKVWEKVQGVPATFPPTTHISQGAFRMHDTCISQTDLLLQEVLPEVQWRRANCRTRLLDDLGALTYHCSLARREMWVAATFRF